VTGETQLRYFNLGLVGSPDPNTYLAWRVSLITANGPWTLYVDANTGAVLARQSHSRNSFDLDLEDGLHGGPHEYFCWAFWSSDQWFDEYGVMGGANPDAEGYAAYNNIRTVYDFWSETLQRDSYDDDGAEIDMYIHVGNPWRQAWYTTWCDQFEFGDGFAADLDVVGHEFTHGVVENTSQLEYEYESGALDESFADVFAHLLIRTIGLWVRVWHRFTGGTWLIHISRAGATRTI